jgi:hypothetical protein
MTDQTASLLEILASIINVIGIVAAGAMLYFTVRRLRAVHAQPSRFPTGREIMAGWRHIRCEAGRIIYHVSSLGLGIWAMSLPDSGSPYAVTAMWLRLLVGLVFTVFSLLDLSTDARLWGMTGRQRIRRGGR